MHRTGSSSDWPVPWGLGPQFPHLGWNSVKCTGWGPTQMGLCHGASGLSFPSFELEGRLEDSVAMAGRPWRFSQLLRPAAHL